MKRKVKGQISNLSKKSEINNLSCKSFSFSNEENLGEPKGLLGHSDSEDEIVGFSSDSEIESSSKGKANKIEKVLSYNQQCYDSDFNKIIWSEDSSSESEVSAASLYPICNKTKQPELHLSAVKNTELKRNIDQLNSTIESDISIDEFNEVISTEEPDKTEVENFKESKEIIKPLLSPIAGHSSDDKLWNAVKQPLHVCSNEFKSSEELIEDLTPSQSTKSIDPISNEAYQQICGMDESMNEPVSVKKKKKVIKGGLVERLQKLVSREKSDLAFWKHDSNKRIDTECVLYLYVSSIKSACSLKIIFCQLFDSTEVFLIMPETTACYLKVKCGVTIKVSPPWSKIFCKDIGKVVLLCAYQINILPSNSPISQSKAASDLIVFSNEQQLNFISSNQIFEDYDGSIVPKTILARNETYSSITQAVKQNDDFVSFTARIQRVFKRVIPKIQCTKSAFVQQLSHQKETEICYTLFVQDKYGMVSEINLPSSIATQNSMWKKAVVDGTNHICKFENLIRSNIKTYKKNLSFVSMLKLICPDYGSEQLDSLCKNKTSKHLKNKFLPFLYIFKINERTSTCHFLDGCDSFQKEYVPSLKVQCPSTTGREYLRGSVTLRLVSVTTSSFDQNIKKILKEECHFHGFCEVNSCNVLHTLRKLSVCFCPQTLVDAVSLKDPSQVHVLSFTDVFIKDCLMTADMFTTISHSIELQDGFSKILEPVSSSLQRGDLFSVKATIIGLTEDFLCDVCFKCNDLTKSEKGRWCVSCHSFTTTRSKMQLGVFLSIPELSYSHVTCELLEETSSALLSILRDKDSEGFDQNSLLGKSFGPKLVQVLDVVRTDVDRGSLLLKEVIQLTT